MFADSNLASGNNILKKAATFIAAIQLFLLPVIFSSCTKSNPINGSTITSLLPNANAGEDQVVTIPINQTISLDGSASKGGISDPIKEYRWKIISPPAYDSVVYNTAGITFFISNADTYIFELTVVSSKGLKDHDTLSISAILDTICNVIRTSTPVTMKELVVLPDGDYDPAIALVSNKLLFLGRSENSLLTPTKIVIYNNDIGDVKVHPLQNGRTNIAIATSGDKVFLAGGLTNDTFFSDVDIYDSQTDTWAKENLSTPRSNCAAVAAMDKVFFAGGFLGINRYSDKIDIYNTLSGTWSSTVLSEPRSGILALHEADKIYFIGGENAGGISCTVDVYDVYTGSMTNFILPFCRKGFSGLVHKNKLYIAGGMSTTDNENFSVQISVQIMDILTKSWSYGCLSEAKFWSKNLPAHVVGDKIFFLGSWADNYNWNTLNSLESYDPINNKWAFVPETNQDTYTPAGVVKNQKIFLLKNQLRLVQNRLVKTNILFETEF